MSIIDDIVGVFTRLFRQKVNSAQAQAKAKVMSAQVRAQSKVTNSLNKKIDKSVKGAKDKVASKAQRK